jgi:hypothetical protein
MMLSSIILLMGLVGSEAKAHNPCQSPSTNLHRDIQLNKNERYLVQEMYATKRELRSAAQQYKMFGESWMVDFVSGEMDRKYIEVTMEELYSTKEDKEFELRHLGFELLEGYSISQREQVIYNMETTQECFEKHKVKERHKTEKMSVRPIKTLLQDLNLTQEQEQAYQQIRKFKEQHRTDLKQDFPVAPEAMYKNFLLGYTDQSTTLQAFESYSDRYYQFRMIKAGMWMDFLGNLSEDQKQQFLHNAIVLDDIRKSKK